jgi:hypothetical protein
VQSNDMHFSQDALVPVPVRHKKNRLFRKNNLPPSQMNVEATPGRAVTPLEGIAVKLRDNLL